jgi:hypothetical protein
LASGVFAAIWFHLSYHSNLILPDSLCALPVLAGAYLLIQAERKPDAGFWRYVLAGLMIGSSVWLRPNAMLMGPFLAVSLFGVTTTSKAKTSRRAVMALVSILVFAPITVRNYLVYHRFVPVQVGMGLNLWTGIAQAGGERFGAVGYDRLVAAQEAIVYSQPSYGTHWYTPDGIARDHDRTKRSLAVIRDHPFWYAGSVFRRLAHMFNYSAEAALVSRGNDHRLAEVGAKDRQAMEAKLAHGVNLDPEERLETQPGPLLVFGRESAWLRIPARAAQRIEKETALVFMFVGVMAMCLLSIRRTLLLLITPAYYLIFQSLVHTEFRYTLPMQYFLFVFAAASWVLLYVLFAKVAKHLLNRATARQQANLQAAERP